MTRKPTPLPDGLVLPRLLPCPFCGREASVTPYRATPTSQVTYSVGCWQEADAFSQNPHWDDCVSPTTLWLPLDRAVEQWNRRQR